MRSLKRIETRIETLFQERVVDTTPPTQSSWGAVFTKGSLPAHELEEIQPLILRLDSATGGFPLHTHGLTRLSNDDLKLLEYYVDRAKLEV
jgi:hypothetical protein